MEPNIILLWLLVWLVYLLVQAIFINGVYIAAYGKTRKRADGTDDDTEMILYPIYKFLHKKHKERVFFIRKMLDISTMPRIDGLLIRWDDHNKFGFRMIGTADVKPLETWIKDFYQGKMVFDPVNKRVAFYVEEDVYDFPSCLRKPTFGCIVCMASFWSILTFVCPVNYFFDWTWHITLLWFADIISVAYVNFYIFKSRA